MNKGRKTKLINENEGSCEEKYRKKQEALREMKENQMHKWKGKEYDEG